MPRSNYNRFPGHAFHVIHTPGSWFFHFFPQTNNIQLEDDKEHNQQKKHVQLNGLD